MPKPRLEQRLTQAIERTRLVTAGDRVGVAVSGGADSVALARLLHAASLNLGIALTVLHFDHQVRPESSGDARFVKALAESRNLPFVCEQADVKATATREKKNIEDTARRLRYKFFADVIRRGLATKIAVAHTMDDQAETVLARLLRGTGPAGLVGIYPQNGAIVRPLLAVRRCELREYLRGIAQDWREDATNRDTTHQRARIREKLLPILENDFSPAAVEHLANLAALSREEEAFWGSLVEDRFRALARINDRTGAVSVSAPKLLAPMEFSSQTHSANANPMRSLTERLVRRLYRNIRGDLLQLTSVHVDQVIHLAQSTASGKCLQLPGNVHVVKNFGELVFSAQTPVHGPHRKETKERASAYQYVVQLSGSAGTDVSIPELASCFRLKVIDWPLAPRETTNWRSILDLDLLRPPLVFRSWRPGDGYRPRGRRKARKLKEMLLAARIGRPERDGWPVLESNGHVVWARGMEPAEDFCAREGTRTALLIEERKL
ncbi:MAG TPA: tRNA lysidine(34) synthetase TilS [Candidatus Aquilonibacter sp.]|nr:tRNA lysidine(34) synthetase TilS [Candidatus Aquilonibacter sp.]